MKKAAIIYVSVICLFAVALVTCVLYRDGKIAMPYPTPRPPVEDDYYRIDLNTATADELQQIPGVGPALAKNIIEYREENGPFTEYSQLLDVKGIGHKKIQVIMEYVRIK